MIFKRIRQFIDQNSQIQRESIIIIIRDQFQSQIYNKQDPKCTKNKSATAKSSPSFETKSTKSGPTPSPSPDTSTAKNYASTLAIPSSSIHSKKPNNYASSPKRASRVIAVQQLDKYLLKQSACQELKWSYELHLIAHKKAARLSKAETSLSTKDAVEQILEMVTEERQVSVRQYESHILMNNKEAIQKMKSSLKEGVDCVLDDEYYLVYYGVIDPKELVSKLLIDDGFPKREHRKALLNKRMNHIGIGIHEHPTQCFVVVIILANHVREIQETSSSQQSSCDCQVI